MRADRDQTGYYHPTPLCVPKFRNNHFIGLNQQSGLLGNVKASPHLLMCVPFDGCDWQYLSQAPGVIAR